MRARRERVVTAEGLERRYLVGGGLFKPAGEVQALRGVSFTLNQGRTLAVVGESGCGKSTSARLVTLIEPPTAGRLEIDGIDQEGETRNPAAFAARCRSFSRTPTAPSIRARRSPISSRSRWSSTEDADDARAAAVSSMCASGPPPRAYAALSAMFPAASGSASPSPAR